MIYVAALPPFDADFSKKLRARRAPAVRRSRHLHASDSKPAVCQ
jgi:hypothetical protein